MTIELRHGDRTFTLEEIEPPTPAEPRLRAPGAAAAIAIDGVSVSPGRVVAGAPGGDHGPGPRRRGVARVRRDVGRRRCKRVGRRTAGPRAGGTRGDPHARRRGEAGLARDDRGLGCHLAGVAPARRRRRRDDRLSRPDRIGVGVGRARGHGHRDACGRWRRRIRRAAAAGRGGPRHRRAAPAAERRPSGIVAPAPLVAGDTFAPVLRVLRRAADGAWAQGRYRADALPIAASPLRIERAEPAAGRYLGGVAVQDVDGGTHRGLAEFEVISR